MATSKSSLALRGYRTYSRVADNLQSFALLILRLGFGLELWFSGYGHLHNVDVMVERFQNWGVPFPRFNVYVSGLTEAIGGILLIFGLGTRLVSIPLVINFLVAYATASRSKLAQMFGGPDRWGGVNDVVIDDAMGPLVASLITLAFGAGKFSIDYLLHRVVGKRRPSAADANG